MLAARRFGADYQINAMSGRGLTLEPLRPGDPTHRQDFAYLGHHNALSAELTAL